MNVIVRRLAVTRQKKAYLIRFSPKLAPFFIPPPAINMVKAVAMGSLPLKASSWPIPVFPALVRRKLRLPITTEGHHPDNPFVFKIKSRATMGRLISLQFYFFTRSTALVIDCLMTIHPQCTVAQNVPHLDETFLAKRPIVGKGFFPVAPRTFLWVWFKVHQVMFMNLEVYAVCMRLGHFIYGWSSCQNFGIWIFIEIHSVVDAVYGVNGTFIKITGNAFGSSMLKYRGRLWTCTETPWYTMVKNHFPKHSYPASGVLRLRWVYKNWYEFMIFGT